MIAKGYGTRISCLYPSHVLRDYEVQMNMFFVLSEANVHL